MPLDFPNSPSVGASYSSSGITWTYDGEKWNIAASGGPSYVTSLPASPIDGQEIYYGADATNGIIWHLRYRSASSSTYKWEYIGGPSLTNYVVTDQTTTSNSIVDLATDGPSITVPVSGDYEINFYATIYNEGVGNNTGGRVWLFINGSQSSPYIEYLSAGDAYSPYSLAQSTRKEISGNKIVKLRYNNRGGSGLAHFIDRGLVVKPIRVG